MPLYQYRALNQAREEIKGEMESPGPDEALKELRDKGLFPTSLRQKFQVRPAPMPSSAPADEGFSFSREKTEKTYTPRPLFSAISLKQLIYFTRQFGTMQEAGLPILRSLELLEKQQKPGPLRRAIRKMIEDIRGGSNLAEAMSKHPRIFSEMYVKMVAAGEAGGVLEPILRRLTEAGERTLDIRRKVIRSAMYPTLVLGFGYLVCIFIMAVVVPLLANAIQEAGGRVAGPMRTLTDISRWFIHGFVPGWLIMIIAPFAVILGIVLIRNSSETGRFLYDAVKLNIPLLGRIAKKFAVARFSRVLGTLIEAGVPIVDAIRISRQVAGNAVFTRGLAKVQEAVRQGEGFTSPLLATGLFDSTFVNMVEVGEETGDLDKMLLKVADNYENEAEMLTTGLTTLLGPVMMIVIGLIVGFIVVNLVSSILGLYSNVMAP